MISKKPMLKENYQSVMMSIDSMQLRNQENIMLLKGKTVTQLLPDLLPLLDGKHTINEIIKELEPCSKEIIEKTIQLLSEHFVIEDGDATENSTISKENLEKYSDMINFLSLFSERAIPAGERVNKYDLFESLQNKICVVYGLGRVGSQLALALVESGIGNIIFCDDNIVDEKNNISMFNGAEGKSRAEAMKKYFEENHFDINAKILSEELDQIENVDMLIYSEDVATVEDLCRINKYCVSNNIPWINIKMGELKFQIGPLVVPNETACYECTLNRLNGNLNHYEEEIVYENFKTFEKENINIFMSDIFIKIAINITVWEVVKYLTRIYSAISTGRVIFFDGLSLELTTSNILKMPKCPICSKREKQPFIEPYAVYLP